jgi:hypothetical protein
MSTTFLVKALTGPGGGSFLNGACSSSLLMPNRRTKRGSRHGKTPFGGLTRSFPLLRFPASGSSTTPLVLRLQRLEPYAGTGIDPVGRATYQPIGGPGSPNFSPKSQYARHHPFSQATKATQPSCTRRWSESNQLLATNRQ